MKVGRFLSNYLKAADIKQPQVVTVSRVACEAIGRDDEVEEKLVLFFKELDQGLVMNKTNLTFMSQYGDDSDQWIGKRVTLKTHMVHYAGKMVPGIALAAAD